MGKQLACVDVSNLVEINESPVLTQGKQHQHQGVALLPSLTLWNVHPWKHMRVGKVRWLLRPSSTLLSSAANTFHLLVCIWAWHVASVCLSVHSDGLFHWHKKENITFGLSQKQRWPRAHRSCASRHMRTRGPSQ